MFSKLSLVVVMLFAVVLSACSGNVADHATNCREWNKNFQTDSTGKSISPISCEEISKAVDGQVVNSVRLARVEGVCYEQAKSSSKQANGLPTITGSNGTWKYINATFGSGGAQRSKVGCNAVLGRCG